MRSLSTRMFRALDLATEGLAIAMLLAGLGAVSLGIVSRYILVAPIPWTVEVGRFAFVWLSLAGIAVVERRRAHFRMDYLVERAPRTIRNVLFAIRELIVLAVLVLLLKEGLSFAELGISAFSSVMQVQLSWIYAALPLSVFLTLVNRLRNLAQDLVAAGEGVPLGALTHGASTGGTE